jgi:hypothetical protein
VNERRFVNRSQPQTLYMAVILSYIQAVFNLLNGLPPDIILVGFLLAAAAYGIANEHKWGYEVAKWGSIAQVVLLFATFGSATLTDLGPLIDLIFFGALVALVWHPMSRDYQRIWFR